MDGHTNGHANGISPHTTRLCPLSESLPKNGEVSRLAIDSSADRGGGQTDT